jgi:hypothetical protein
MSRHGFPQLHRGRRLATIQAIDSIPLGRGHKRIATLACGHKVNITWQTTRKVGMRTHCPECR